MCAGGTKLIEVSYGHLAGLGKSAEIIGEANEEQRCKDFIVQLDPDWNADSTLAALQMPATP